MGNVPNLRFPQFSGEWEKEEIGKYIDILSGFAFKSEEMNVEGFGKAILRGINITEGFIRHSKEIDKYYSGSLERFDKYLLQVNDLVLGMDGSKVGKNIALIKDKDCSSLLIQRVARLREKDNSDIKFIYHHLNSSIFHRYVDIVNTSSGIPHISLNQIKNFQIYFPQKQEQEKIASFLSSMNKKIEKLEEKLAFQEKYKKAMMQKLFSQEIRFKADDGSNFSSWEEKNGNEIFETITNKKHNSDLPILAITQEYGAVPRDMIDYKVIVSDKSISTYKVIEIGDFIISLRSFQGGIEYSNYKGLCSPAYIILREHIPISKDFFKSYFKTKRYIKLLNRHIEGIRDGKIVSFKQFSEIKYPFPSVKEQQKIANFLSSLDKKIEATKKQKQKAQEFKKGLLQQMFV